ncbi:MAG: cupin domain-containing protein [Acidobacteriota bacterium]
MAAYTKRSYPPENVRGWQFIWKELELEWLGVTFIRLGAHEGAGFTHSHERQEEIYYVLEGSPALRIDGKLVPLRRGDMVRVRAQARRAVGNPSDEEACLLVAGGMPHDTAPRSGRPSRIGDGIPHKEDKPTW